MTKYRKQHIIPETYLKYFSKDNSGLGIVALDLSKQNNQARYYNQGDRIFWKEYFYRDYRFEDNLLVERFLGEVIEPTYHDLIKCVIGKVSLNEWEIKILFLQWIIFNKLRSPVFRKDIEVKLKFLYQNSNILADTNDAGFLITDKIITKYAKQLHMDYFVDINKFTDYVNLMVTGLMVKKWKILIAPEKHYFWTTDNPGFSIFIKDYEETGNCFPYGYMEKFSSDSVHYYPLTQKYCIELGPYLDGDSSELNFKTDIIDFKLATAENCEQINKWSSFTACDFIIMDETVMNH